MKDFLLHSELMPLVIASGGFLIFVAVEIIRAIVRGSRAPTPLPPEMARERVIELISRPAVVERRTTKALTCKRCGGTELEMQPIRANSL